MHPTSTLHIGEREVVELINLQGAIGALERVVRAQARGLARNVPKTLATWGDGNAMHALGSLMPEQGYLGFKTWAITKRGGAPIFSLFDANDGSLLALIEARALGQLRTSGISGVATRLLASAEADSMGLIGTGAQAMLQVAAVAAVRPLRCLRVFSPTPARRQSFVAAARARFDFEVVEVSSVPAALEGASIVTLITRAREPFVSVEMLAKGAHLNAVGAILPTHAEFEQDVLQNAGLVAVDDMENARRGSRELIEHYGAGEEGWASVRTLGGMLEEGESCPTSCRLSVFKGMGMGLSDLALATLVYERAREGGRGTSLPPSARVPASEIR